MSKVIRKKISIAIFLLLFITASNTSRSEESVDAQTTVFCTNNKDGTGSCLTSSQEPVECILIPGSVVECTDENDNELSCVSVHSTSAIVEISCEKTKTSIEPADTLNIPSTDKELKPGTIFNNNIGADESESTSEAYLKAPERPLREDVGESPFVDPF